MKPNLSVERVASVLVIAGVAATGLLAINKQDAIKGAFTKILLIKLDYTLGRDSREKLKTRNGQEILKGGYILHVRHAERDKWIDVKIYDAFESDVQAMALIKQTCRK